MTRLGAAAAASVLVLQLAACASVTGPSGADTRTIGPAGGTLHAVGTDGTAFTLAVPADALDAPTSLTLAPLAGPPGALAAVALSPADVVFAAPAHLTVALGQGVATPVLPWLGLGPSGDRTPVPTLRSQGGRVLETELRIFDVAAVSAASAAGAMGPAQSGGGATISAFESDCLAQLDSTKAILDGFLATNNYQAALRTMLATAALASTCGLVEQVDVWLADTETVACARYDDLALLAQTVAADTYDTFMELVHPLVNWASELQTLGAECGDPAVTSVIGEKFSQFLTFYSAVVANSMTSEYEDIVDEVNKVYTLRGRASTLSLPDVESQLETQVLFPLMDLLRVRGYELCNSDQDHYYLSALLEAAFDARRVPIGTMSASTTGSRPGVSVQGQHAPFEDADIHEDLQYCASSVDVEVWADPDVPYEVTDQRRSLDGGTSPGGGTRRAEALAPIEGHLVLRGDVAAFRCDQARTLESDELALEFEAREVDRVSASGGSMLQSPREVEVRELVDVASLDPDALNTGAFVFERHSPACGGTYGDAEYDLFTLDLTIDPVPTASAVSADAASLTADAMKTVVFTLAFEDRGENLETLAVRFVLAEKEQAFEVALPSGAGVAGFDAATGEGTYTVDLTVFCSEADRSPLEARFTLIDAFQQESEEVFTTLAVAYGACP